MQNLSQAWNQLLLKPQFVVLTVGTDLVQDERFYDHA